MLRNGREHETSSDVGRAGRGPGDEGYPVYEMLLSSRSWSLIFLLVLVVPMSLLILATLRIVVAQNWGGSLNPERVRHAIALDPSNPMLHFALGKILLLNAEPSTQAAAEQEFRTAVKLNRYSAVFWSGLGKACYSSENQSCADAAFRRAQELAPSNPQFAWEAGVYDVVLKRREAAIGQLKTFLRLQPDGLEQSFSLLMRGFDNPNVVWGDLLGASSDPLPKVRFLDYLVDNNNFEAADAFWQQLAGEKTKLPLTILTPYVDRLIATGHYRQATQAWAYATHENWRASESGTSDQTDVFNGGFEQEPLNAGFDWRFRQQPYIELDFSDPNAHDGQRALRIDFTVPQNFEYELAYQLVPVIPGQTYELSGFI